MTFRCWDEGFPGNLPKVWVGIVYWSLGKSVGIDENLLFLVQSSQCPVYISNAFMLDRTIADWRFGLLDLFHRFQEKSFKYSQLLGIFLCQIKISAKAKNKIFIGLFILLTTFCILLLWWLITCVWFSIT